MLAVVTLLLATTLLGRLLIAINLFGNTLFAAMFFPCVAGFLWWRASTIAAWTCLITGWTIGLAIAIYANFLAVPEVPFSTWARWIYVYLMPGICVLGGVVSYLTRPAAAETERRVRFFARVGEAWIK